MIEPAVVVLFEYAADGSDRSAQKRISPAKTTKMIIRQRCLRSANDIEIDVAGCGIPLPVPTNPDIRNAAGSGMVN